MIRGPVVVAEPNLSVAWARAFLAVMQEGVEELQPLLVTVTGLDGRAAPEVTAIRRELDGRLSMGTSRLSCERVASTIFPLSLWNPKRTRAEFFRRYAQVLPRLRRYPQNRLGMYFERLVAFGGDSDKGNQLEHIITTYLDGNHRRSALQAMLFDPTHDHSNKRRQGFPCLQQVAFVPQDHGGLAVTGFYATQYLFDRAYGNYLGLCNLGLFMAQEMDLRLTQMNCFAAVGLRGGLSKRDLGALARRVESLVPEEVTTRSGNQQGEFDDCPR